MIHLKICLVPSLNYTEAIVHFRICILERGANDGTAKIDQQVRMYSTYI